MKSIIDYFWLRFHRVKSIFVGEYSKSYDDLINLILDEFLAGRMTLTLVGDCYNAFVYEDDKTKVKISINAQKDTGYLKDYQRSSYLGILQYTVEGENREVFEKFTIPGFDPKLTGYRPSVSTMRRYYEVTHQYSRRIGERFKDECEMLQLGAILGHYPKGSQYSQQIWDEMLETDNIRVNNINK